MTTTSSSEELPLYMRFARAFELFHQYEGDSPFVRAEHDVLYAGPAPASVSPEHRAELEQLGWMPDQGMAFYCFV